MTKKSNEIQAETEMNESDKKGIINKIQEVKKKLSWDKQAEEKVMKMKIKNVEELPKKTEEGVSETKVIEMPRKSGPGIGNPASTKQEISEEDIQNVNKGMTISLNQIKQMISDVRRFREMVDFNMKVIELTGLKSEIYTKTNMFNPIEHTITNLILAKGSMGELLKYLVPSIELIGLECYNAYLALCKKHNQEPVGKGMTYPYLPKEYMDGLFSTIQFMLKDETIEINPEWTEVEKEKFEMIKTIVSDFKNPYTYPKQKPSDVEPVANSVEVKDLDIELPKGKYFKNGIELEFASQLNRVQLVDWIKGNLSGLLEDFVAFKFNTILRRKLSLYNKYSDKNIDVLLLAIINTQATYTNLVNAKNMFGYTFQYVK